MGLTACVDLPAVHGAPLHGRAALIRGMSVVNDELERTSSMLRTEPSAVIVTAQDPLVAIVCEALKGTGLKSYRTRDAEEARHCASAPFVRLFALDLEIHGAIEAVRYIAHMRNGLLAAPIVGLGSDQDRRAADAGAAAVVPMPLCARTLRALFHSLLKPTD